MPENQEYDGEDIHHYSTVEGIRKRPAMYLGGFREPVRRVIDLEESPAPAITAMLLEATCLALHDCFSGKASWVLVTRHRDGSLSVADDGECHAVMQERPFPYYETLLTQIHACRDGKEVHRELCTTGIVVTNALSRWLTIDVTCDGQQWHQRFEQGKPVEGIRVVEKSGDESRRISFLPDESVLRCIDLDVEDFVTRFQSQSCGLESCSITFEDKTGEETIDLLTATVG